MRNAVLVVLAGIVCVLWFSLHSQSITIKALQRNLNSANETAAAARKDSKAAASISLDLQANCARQAQAWFKFEGWGHDKYAAFTDHYNASLGKCFVEIGNITLKDVPNPTSSKSLYNAFEGSIYGNYMENPNYKNNWEMPPFMCSVTLLSGDEKQCHSSEEFNELVKQYMGDAYLH